MNEKSLDLRGLKCPLPVLKTRKALNGMQPGELLCVLTTDPMASLDIPHMCNEDGHALQEKEATDFGNRFLICKA